VIIYLYTLADHLCEASGSHFFKAKPSSLNNRSAKHMNMQKQYVPTIVYLKIE